MAAKVLRTQVLTDTVPAARRALAAAPPGRAILASPYLTSGDEALAEAVIGAGDPSRTVVLTTFDAMTFATGGSSLATLRSLLKLCDLRSLPSLHAKVVLTEGAQIVGSQNLTLQGTRNKEIGLRLSDPTVAAALREKLEGWIAESQPITERGSATWSSA
jgi:phosphatidylserine/phosphatidylglycerophosphate/cardiolipin synthase-like enzyme